MGRDFSERIAADRPLLRFLSSFVQYAHCAAC